MTKAIIMLMALLAAGCMGGGSPALEEALESCSADNGVYRLTAARLSDGALACEVEPVDTEGPTYQAEDCAGPEPCGCAAVFDGMSWDFIWLEGGLPEAECYPLAAPWMPCGCGTRLDFSEEGCD